MSLPQRIAAIRRRVRLVQAGEAWGWTFGAALLAALVAGVVDVALRLRAWPLRVLLTALVLATVVWAVRRWLVPWWQASYSDVQIARRLEQLHPRLGERLSSALAFLQQGTADAREGSLELRYAVVAEAEAIAADLPLETSVDARVRNRAIAVSAFIACVVLALALWQPINFGRAALRMAWPVGGPAWPPRHQLELVNAPSAVALGESFEVAVIDRNGRFPADAAITLQFDRPAWRSERHLLQQRGDKLVFRVEQVMQGFRYQVTGGDSPALGWQELVVVQPPKLTDLIAMVQPPAYSGLKADRTGRLIKLLAGSQLAIEGKLDRPAKVVRLSSVSNSPTPEIALSTDGRSFRTAANGNWLPEKTEQIWIELVDETGAVTGRDGPLELQIIADAPPAIAWDQPGDHSAFTSQALVPIAAIAKDDLAVRRVELRFAEIGSEATVPQTVVLFERAEPPAKSLGEGDLRPVSHAWDLSQLKVAAEDASFSIQLAATDFKGQETISPPRRVSTISTQDMQHRLVQRQGAILEQLSEVLRLQRQARSSIGEVAARQADEGRWQPRDLDVLQSADVQQRQVQRLLKNPDDGLAKQIELLLAELKANRLSEEGIGSRMQTLQKQVRRLTDDVLPPLEEQLAAALKGARLRSEQNRDGGCDEDGLLPLGGVTEQQDAAVAALEAMLGELAQWDSYSRIAREIGLLKQEQTKLREQTESVRVALALAERDSEPLQLAKQTAQRQLETARQFDKLQQRMEALLARLQDGDPLAAGSLADALDSAQRLAIGGQMRSAARQLQDTRAGNAVQTQDQVLAGLAEVLDRLASRRDQNAQRTLAGLTAAAGELDQLVSRNENLAREAAAAAAAKDPQKRQLQRLTRDAQRLAEEAAELSRKLQRLQAKGPAEAIKQASSSLGRGSQAAGAGDGGAAEQQTRSALEELQQAKQQLQQEIQKAQEDLVREELARLETELSGLLKRQQNLLEETQRLELAKKAADGTLSRAQQASLHDLAEEQRLLADAAQQSSETFSSGESFQLALAGVKQQMLRAQRSLARGQTDAGSQLPQEQAIARLKQMLDAARSQADQLEDEGKQEQGPAQPNDGPPQIGSIGELQLLQQLQLEINRRTAELEAERARQGDFTAEQETELLELAEEQGKLAEIILNLIQKPADESEENQPPDPKPLPDNDKPMNNKPSGNPLDEELLKELK